jgi:hypothetical protein
MKKLKYYLFFILPLAVLSCDPIEDRDTLGSTLTPGDVQFSVTQESDYDNKVFLDNQTAGVIPFWEYGLGTSTRDQDTIVYPFAGDYWIKFTAYGRAGAVSDSTMITVSENDANYFADPGWQLLTNGVDGKYWKLARVTLGPATDYKSIWGDVGWWSSDAYNWTDSAYFDLNGGFNYKRYHNGDVVESSFTFNPNEVLAGTVIPEPGKSIFIPSPNQMPVKDGSNEMSEANKTKYRVYKLNADTLIVGQGSYYTQSRNVPGENWSYYHWYVKVD